MGSPFQATLERTSESYQQICTFTETNNVQPASDKA